MPLVKKVSRSRAVDVLPVGAEDPERALALHKHAEGITKSQDKGKRAKDADPALYKDWSDEKLKTEAKRYRDKDLGKAAKRYETELERRKSEAKDTELPLAVKPVGLVPMPSGEHNEVSYATRRAKDAAIDTHISEAKRLMGSKKFAAAEAHLDYIVAHGDTDDRDWAALQIKNCKAERAKATDSLATLPLQTSGSEPKDHMLRANQYEVQGDRARALDSYRAAATGYRRANDRANEAKARDGVAACQSVFDAQYAHPGAGRVKVCDSAESAMRTAVERTRAGESVRITDGKTVRPRRAKDDTDGPPPVDNPSDPEDPSPVPTGDSFAALKKTHGDKYSDEVLKRAAESGREPWSIQPKEKAKDSKREVQPV
jgi:hypothetical protein